MKLALMSDLHGTLPEVEPCDIAIIAGDVVPATEWWTKDGLLEQVRFVHDKFIPWLQSMPAKHVAVTWGNHDAFADQKDGSLIPRLWWPENVHILVNSTKDLEIDGETVRLYGVPQTPRFFDWSFNLDDTQEQLGMKWAAVAYDTDILISHGPPRGCVDWVGKERVGSKTMERWLKGEASNRPKLIVCGHIHAAGGNTGVCGASTIMNVALANEAYRQVRKPKYVEWPL